MRLPVAQYPEIAPPTITVSGQYPGASADVVAATVVTPIEQQINGVENMIYLSSNSTGDGRFTISVTFELGTNLDIAQVQVQNRVSIAQPRLPTDVRNIGVTVNKSSPDLMMVVHLYSPDKSRDTLFISNYATIEITDAVTRVDGVGSLIVFGSRDYAMRAWLDPDRLQSLGLTANDVVNALAGQNVQVASGVLNQPPMDKSGAFQISVQTLGRLTSTEEFGNIVVKQTANAVVRMKDIARIELAAQDYSTNSYLDRDPAIAHRHLPAAGLERAFDREEHQGHDGRARQAIPAGAEIRHRLQSHRNSSSSRSTRCKRRSARRSSWSCWSSSCSCRPGAPRSSRSSPFRCR